MVKRFFMKFYLVLIIAFLYIPIAVLVVLSFNASRSRVVWGGFTLKWYQILLHNSDVVGGVTEHTDNRFRICSASLPASVCWPPSASMRNEETKLLLITSRGKHSDVECRYCDRYCSDAVVFQIYKFGLCQYFTGACNIQYSICDFEHPAETATDGYECVSRRHVILEQTSVTAFVRSHSAN
ncbi:MAG: ABC transporter permease [Eubacterium ramulus]